MLDTHCESNPAARGELRGHNCLAWCACLYKIIQNAVGDGFVESPLVSIRSEIKLERLTFDAKTVRYVIDVDPGKIGLARDWAN